MQFALISALRSWLLRRQPPCAVHILHRRNIYVLPCAAGAMLAITLLVLLIASINFQLNLGFALTFLIAASACASLWMGYRNLHGLQLSLRPLAPVFQGTQAIAGIELHSTRPARRYAMALAFNQPPHALAWAYSDITPKAACHVELGWQAQQRGWQRLPRISIETRFPLGIFRLWSYWQPNAFLLVYPAPENPMPPIQLDNVVDTSTGTAFTNAGSESDGVRGYQRGDPMRDIVWKKTATALASGSGDLVVRHGAGHTSRNLWLTAAATGLSDREAQISRLTAWVLHAHAQQWSWGLHLPSGQQIKPAAGEQHLHNCLSALAMDGLPAINLRAPT